MQTKEMIFIYPHLRIWDMLIDFRETERERETSIWERNIHLLPPIHSLTKDWTRNLGMCPDQESNPQPFGVQDDASTN